MGSWGSDLGKGVKYREYVPFGSGDLDTGDDLRWTSYDYKGNAVRANR